MKNNFQRWLLAVLLAIGGAVPWHVTANSTNGWHFIETNTTGNAGRQMINSNLARITNEVLALSNGLGTATNRVAGASNVVFLSARSDGRDGTGTHADPRDASTATKFDTAIRPLLTNRTVVLFPGEYRLTNLYKFGDNFRLLGEGAGVNLHFDVTNAPVPVDYSSGLTRSNGFNVFEGASAVTNCVFRDVNFYLHGEYNSGANTNHLGALGLYGAFNLYDGVQVFNPRGNGVSGQEGFTLYAWGIAGIPGGVNGGNVIRRSRVSARGITTPYDYVTAISAGGSVTGATNFPARILDCTVDGDAATNLHAAFTIFGVGEMTGCTAERVTRGLYLELHSSGGTAGNDVVATRNTFLDVGTGYDLTGVNATSAVVRIEDNFIRAVSQGIVNYTPSGVVACSNWIVRGNAVFASSNALTWGMYLDDLRSSIVANNYFGPNATNTGGARWTNVNAWQNLTFAGTPATTGAVMNAAGLRPVAAGSAQLFYNSDAGEGGWTLTSSNGNTLIYDARGNLYPGSAGQSNGTPAYPWPAFFGSNLTAYGAINATNGATHAFGISNTTRTDLVIDGAGRAIQLGRLAGAGNSTHIIGQGRTGDTNFIFDLHNWKAVWPALGANGGGGFGIGYPSNASLPAVFCVTNNDPSKLTADFARLATGTNAHVRFWSGTTNILSISANHVLRVGPPSTNATAGAATGEYWVIELPDGTRRKITLLAD